MKIKSLIGIAIISFCSANLNAQTPKSYTSSEILLQIKKLNVLGSVLYVAAHPDDENTRLLAYLANEKLYRTGYLSLTRGDGGQNLIGDEQGVDLGLIRTQELLAARRVDGAEQFFSRAFDFGFSKSPEEAMRIWNHDKILSDVVWVIRKFKPDVIITRFPTTGEGGHGHHTASAILAGEAFDAAADPTKFPEQLKYVSVWQAKRLLWNTFNFGGNNTQRDDQLKLDCGDYNAILGKSYGEIAAASRSMHKSQGFGVPGQRGSILEYFKTIKGAAPVNDLMDGINISWNRTANDEPLYIAGTIKSDIEKIITNYSAANPEKSVADLVKLYGVVDKVEDSYWREQKQAEIKKIIENCSGLFMEAVANTQYAVQGDSLKVTLTVNNRSGANILSADAQIDTTYVIFDQLRKNTNAVKTYTWFIEPDAKLTQPYWLESQKEKGSFNVDDQLKIGKAENDPLSVTFSMMIEGKEFVFTKPVVYKYTDPVKGELYQPVNIITPAFVGSAPSLVLFNIAVKNQTKNINFIVQANKVIADSIKLAYNKNYTTITASNLYSTFTKGEKKIFTVPVSNVGLANNDAVLVNGIFTAKKIKEKQLLGQRKISYDHIPDIIYNHVDPARLVNLDLKTEGNYAGYIPGAGDKIPEALEQMGYKVVTLKESDMTPNNLRQFDVIVTGVRTYNTNEWMNNVYDVLMKYVKEGGVLFTQYNTSNQIGPVRAKIAPYPFTISRNRITDEEAKVNFLIPEHKALNHPNKITAKDFDGWIQERSIYNAENVDTAYRKILSMKDPGENEQEGSLIIANYGKGRFVYTGLVFFRELPAGVPGAYRLFANLIANKRVKYVK
ncbi:PIG-L family deacetylase [Ferruginibacter sp.]|nr:PIG-L family deacetylase [Ferruginibacter sp.]